MKQSIRKGKGKKNEYKKVEEKEKGVKERIEQIKEKEKDVDKSRKGRKRNKYIYEKRRYDKLFTMNEKMI